MKVGSYFSQDAIAQLEAGINEACGNEVFFTGEIDADGIVVSVRVGARGTSDTVPVNFSDARGSRSSVLIHNHPGGNLLPSPADLAVASDCAERAQGFYIVNNSVTDVYVVVEPVRPRKIHMIDLDEAGGMIAAGGALSALSDNFEERPVQIALLRSIGRAFNESLLGVFEAGTGVGKSYAYLIPAIIWAVSNNEKVVVSTGTINLQQQLCEKDIPAVERILGKKIRFVLMKGRQNYICKRRISDALSVLDLFEDESDELKRIAQWAGTSASGSKSEIPFVPSESAWSKICSESDACMGMRCPSHSSCFVMQVRKEAAGANLIVVNHHLLFADIESRMSGAGYSDAAVLPPYRHLIFDEAHGIESAATSFFSENLTRFKINRLVSQMYRKKKNSYSGHLCSLAILSSNEEQADRAYELSAKIRDALANLEIAASDLLAGDYTMRLSDGSARDFGPFLVSAGELSRALGAFTDMIRSVIDGIADEDLDAPCCWESKIILRRLDSCCLLLRNFLQWDEKKDFVYWIQKKRLSAELSRESGNPDFYILNETPLDISYMMNKGVFEQMQSVVCTSATLRTGRDYRYWMGRTGLMLADSQRISVSDYPSPFPYEKNMLFAVPSDAPFPDSSEYQQYIEMVIPRLIEAAEGRTLVLFTSYESLRSAHRTVVSVLRSFSGRIMRQGDDDSARLLESFKEEKESVLFATDSFWQGVDIPGESLSQVIIVKLPFSVPNDPVFVARSEAIEKRGGSSFMELSVPEAVIKFRQGVGRLIRRSDDKGVVVVLDRRIYEKRYGANFLATMPPCRKIYEPMSAIIKKINSFIFD